MNFKVLLFFGLSVLACSSSEKTVNKPSTNVSDYQNTITEEGLYLDLAILASDSLEGRATGSEGERKAAEYLANRYKEFGLLPAGDNSTYFQNYQLQQTSLDSIQYTVKLGDADEIKSTHSNYSIADFSKLQGGPSASSGDIVFVGYGILDEGNSVNHFSIDVAGKWVLSFYDPNISSYATIQRLIREENAVGAILISGTDEDDFRNQAIITQAEFGTLSRLKLPYLEDQDTEGTFIRINPTFASQLLGLNNVQELAELESTIKTNPTAFSPFELTAHLTHTPFVSTTITETRNVVALLEGTHPELKDEVVILTSHYDHLGIGGAPNSNSDTIYNGADDDGSGTVGLLHTAQALALAKKAGANIQRSVLFVNVTGEERGLLGSRFYSDHPYFPIEQSVANLNLDMIGRRDQQNSENPDYIYIIGGKIISSGLQATLEEANQNSVNIELSDRYNDLNDPQQFYRRSDHWNFGRLGIPFIFFFNGTHADYHRPSDEVTKIDFEALRKRTQLIFMTTALLANSDDRPQVDNVQFIEKTKQ